jgi:nucleoside-diphosphate-sugar epimerase
MASPSIAVLGATGYIGSSLTRTLLGRGLGVTAHARNPQAVGTRRRLLSAEVCALDDFDAARFGLIINCLGAGDPAQLADLGQSIVSLTDRWDEQILSTMGDGAQYVFLSSGAVYGELRAPATAESALAVALNADPPLTPYTVAKLRAELRHRAAPDQRVLDLRVFGYADPALDPMGSFLLSDLARAIQSDSRFATAPADIVRDYAGADELADLILAWVGAGGVNSAADLYTRAPLTKHQLIAECQERFGLKVDWVEPNRTSTTGSRLVYASAWRRAEAWGYAPSRTALDVAIDALQTFAAA